MRAQIWKRAKNADLARRPALCICVNLGSTTHKHTQTGEQSLWGLRPVWVGLQELPPPPGTGATIPLPPVVAVSGAPWKVGRVWLNSSWKERIEHLLAGM